MPINNMRIVFVGSSQFGLRCLKTCLKAPSVKLAGVVTAPRSFAISYRPEGVNNVLYADLADLAKKHSVPVQTLQRSMNEPKLLEEVLSWEPDAFIVAGWYHMIPQNWRLMAPAYGLHASLLPDYSGGAPLVWAIINGETKTGITMFKMDDGVDSGPIVGQKEEPIYPNDTIATLYARIEDRGLELLDEVLPKLAEGTLILRVQDETKRRILPQRSPKDGWIDWSQNVVLIDRFIRAQTKPYPGAYTSFNGKPLHVWCASVSNTPETSTVHGKVIRREADRYLVSCGNEAIELIEISYEQKNYCGEKLSNLFGQGGQILGELPNCLLDSKSY